MSAYFPKLDLNLMVNKSHRKAETKFPCKLHQMLIDVERQGLTDIISWHNDGQCFRVHDPEALVDKILPMYFKKSKFRSFQRQLNLYGFQRVTATKPFWESCYYHPDFERDVKGSCQKINRPLRRNRGDDDDGNNAEDDDVASVPVDFSALEVRARKHIPDHHATFNNRVQSTATVRKIHENIGVIGHPHAPASPAQYLDQGTAHSSIDSSNGGPSTSGGGDINAEELFAQIDGKALTRRDSYKDLCDSILGPNCAACKDGDAFENNVFSTVI
jgi:HSF-type DNA-binding